MAGQALLTEKHEELVEAAVAWLRSCREGDLDYPEHIKRTDALAAAVEPFMPEQKKVNN